MIDSNSGQKIVVLGTGGTIAGYSALVNDNIGYAAGQIGIEALTQGVPGLAQHLQGQILVFEQLAQIDSKDMDFTIWKALACRVALLLVDPDVQGIVITHGTDTIEETAFFLHSVVSSNKPIVLTCAMRPASALSPDGPQNLLDAFSVVMDVNASGVVVVCAGVVHAAEHVQKIHPYRLDAFRSGEAGPLAWIEEAKVRWSLNAMPKNTLLRSALTLPESGAWPQVEIVLNHVGANGKVVDALLMTGVEGLVVACTGNGTVSNGLMASLQRAMSKGVRVVRSTRCALGRVISTPDAAVPDSQGLSPVKARVALMLTLMK